MYRLWIGDLGEVRFDDTYMESFKLNSHTLAFIECLMVALRLLNVYVYLTYYSKLTKGYMIWNINNLLLSMHPHDNMAWGMWIN